MINRLDPYTTWPLYFNFAENYFIDAKEREAMRQQHPNLDESPESEKMITDLLNKRYPGYGERLKRINPDAVIRLCKDNTD